MTTLLWLNNDCRATLETYTKQARLKHLSDTHRPGEQHTVHSQLAPPESHCLLLVMSPAPLPGRASGGGGGGGGKKRGDQQNSMTKS